MEKNKDNQKQKKKKEECPLCKISEDTIKRLRKESGKKTKEKSAENNGRSRNRK